MSNKNPSPQQECVCEPGNPCVYHDCLSFAPDRASRSVANKKPNPAAAFGECSKCGRCRSLTHRRGGEFCHECDPLACDRTHHCIYPKGHPGVSCYVHPEMREPNITGGAANIGARFNRHMPEAPRHAPPVEPKQTTCPHGCDGTGDEHDCPRHGVTTASMPLRDTTTNLTNAGRPARNADEDANAYGLRCVRHGQMFERARIERIIKSMAPHGWDDAGSFVLRDDVLAAIRGEGDDA